MTLRLPLTGIVLLLAGCLNPIGSATRTPKPLSYVGTIHFGAPAVNRQYVKVPMQYSGGEWAMNSGLVPHDVDVRVTDRSIEFTVIVAVVGSRREEAGYQLRLPASLKGRYQLVYRDPNGVRHPLESIDL